MTLKSTDINNQTGLFIATYEIGKPQPGAPMFKLQTSVFTPDRTVNGLGHIHQETNPPVNVVTQMQGTFTYMTVMPNNTHILVVLNGYANNNNPTNTTFSTTQQPNCELRMILNDDWKTGTATYRYRDTQGTWHEVENTPVNLVPGKTLT